MVSVGLVLLRRLNELQSVLRIADDLGPGADVDAVLLAALHDAMWERRLRPLIFDRAGDVVADQPEVPVGVRLVEALAVRGRSALLLRLCRASVSSYRSRLDRNPARQLTKWSLLDDHRPVDPLTACFSRNHLLEAAHEDLEAEIELGVAVQVGLRLAAEVATPHFSYLT